MLEPVRAKFDKPITITSGYRSEELCEAIGSKKTSQHAKGQAVDFEIAGVPNIKVAYWLQNNVDFDQLILEFYNPDDNAGGWVHISYNENDIKVWEAKIENVDMKNIEPGKVLRSDNEKIVVKCGDDAIALMRHEFIQLPKVGEYL